MCRDGTRVLPMVKKEHAILHVYHWLTSVSPTASLLSSITGDVLFRGKYGWPPDVETAPNFGGSWGIDRIPEWIWMKDEGTGERHRKREE